MRRPAFMPVPETALRVLMGEMSDVLLAGQRIVPAAVLASGYEFRHSSLAPALADLVSKG